MLALNQSRATFSERGPDETFQSSSRAGVTNENPARWMSLTRAECHSDGGPRGGSEGETSCTSFWRRAVRNSRCRQTMKHGYDALNMRNECRKIPRRDGDVAEKGQWRRIALIYRCVIRNCLRSRATYQ